MFQNVVCHVSDTLCAKQRCFRVDCFHLFISYRRFFFHRVHVINAERQHVAIVDSIHDGIGVQFVAKCLGRRLQIMMLARPGVLCKNWCAGKAENMIILEILSDTYMHITKL